MNAKLGRGRRTAATNGPTRRWGALAAGATLQLAIAMACRSGGLSVAQAIRAATYGAARSLGRENRVGSLVPGHQADIVVLDLPRHEDLAYRLGRNSVTTVVKAGRVVKEPSS